jgi:prophage regulatory protein
MSTKPRGAKVSSLLSPIALSKSTVAVASPARFLRLPSVLERVPYSRPNLYRLVRLGKFPKPISLGGRAVAWIESEVNDWMAERVKAARDVSQQ